VSIQDVDRNLAESFGLDRPRGALIAQVGGDSPAEQAGLQPGDIIIAFDGESIETSADLPHVVGLIAPGTVVEATVVREGQKETVDVEVGGLGADEMARVDAGVSPDGSVSLLGMRFGDAEPEVLSDLGISGGVAVLAVAPDSPADEAGVLMGDILTRLGSRPISRTADLDDAAAELEAGKSVPARLIRGGSPLFIGIRVPETD
jgi:serine protease Do